MKVVTRPPLLPRRAVRSGAASFVRNRGSRFCSQTGPESAWAFAMDDWRLAEFDGAGRALALSPLRASRPYVPGPLSLVGLCLLSWAIFAGPLLVLFAHRP